MVDFPLFLYEIADVHLKTKNHFHLCILLPVSFPVPSAFFLIPFQHRSYFLYFHTAILAYTEFYFLHTISQMLFEISKTAAIPQISLFLTLFQYALTLPVTDMRTADCSADAIIPKILFQSYMQYQFSAFFHTALFQLKRSAHRSFLSCEVPNCVS